MAEQARKKSRGKQPISRHPLFPATVALWFGALFGLGSLVIRPALLEMVVLATHLDTIIPAAAPPLGVTARILLALAMAGLGGFIGAAVARRIARSKPATHQRKRSAVSAGPAASPKANPFLDDADDAAGWNVAKDDRAQTATVPGIRRALAIHEEPAPPNFEEDAPLPGGVTQVLNIREFGLDGFSSGPPQEWESEDDSETAEPDLRDVAERDPASKPPAEEPHEAPAYREQDDAAAAGAGHSGSRLFDSPAVPGQSEAPQPHDQPFDAPASFAMPDETLDGAPEPEPAPEPLEEAETELADAPEADTTDTTPAARSAGPIALALPEESAADRIASADLGELSHVELLERLALSLEQRRRELALAREAASVRAEPAEAVRLVPDLPLADESGLSTSTETAETLADEQATGFSAIELPEPAGEIAPLALPAALRPVGLDDESAEETIPGFAFQRNLAMPASGGSGQTDAEEHALAIGDGETPAEEVPPVVGEAAATVNEDAADEPDEESRILDDGYSSLLDLKRPLPAKQPFIRVEEPEPGDPAIKPVVVFPGQEPTPSGPADVQPEAEAAAQAEEAQSSARPRPFDAPEPEASQAGPVKAASAHSEDPEETERALRTALATLQRMSGAA